MGDIITLVLDAAGAERRERSVVAGECGVGSGKRDTHCTVNHKAREVHMDLDRP